MKNTILGLILAALLAVLIVLNGCHCKCCDYDIILDDPYYFMFEEE